MPWPQAVLPPLPSADSATVALLLAHARLLNNAGMAYKGNIFGLEEARATLATNFEGTAAVCEAMKPKLGEHARIVNVTRWAGTLSFLGPWLGWGVLLSCSGGAPGNL